MANKIMKTLKFGGVTYELVDLIAREEIEKLKLVTVTPDKTLSIDGAAADALATGTAIEAAKEEMGAKIEEQIGQVIVQTETEKTYAADTNPYIGVSNDGSVFGVDEDGERHVAYSDVNEPPYPVTSVTGKTGDVTPTHITSNEGVTTKSYGDTQTTVGVESSSNAGKVALYHYTGNDASESVLSYTSAGGVASTGTIFTTSHLPTTSEVATSGSEGQIVACNNSGTLSPNTMKISDVVTKAMFSFDSSSQILRITM